MNKTLVMTILILSMTMGSGYAGMGAKMSGNNGMSGHQGMGSRQAIHNMGGQQMMHQQMQHDMFSMINRMGGVMDRMSRNMRSNQMDAQSITAMGKMMNKMSSHMESMAGHMTGGEALTPGQADQINQDITRIDGELDAIEKRTLPNAQ
ncbi:MAG: hypothetical protein GXP53_06580 [Deltaproteobacteria bacterium]|nr:hypothetical protein [Deltaproteobacteria bacterium]